ncbi:hypothetical protein BsWGS_00811 [Bradybaena similaris]
MDAGMIWRCCRVLYSSRTSSLSRLAFSGVCQQSRRPISSESHAQDSNLRTVFRTNVDDPRQHTVDQEGLYYKISEQETNTLFTEGIHPWYRRLTKTFNETCLMVRRPAVELNSYIRNINLNHPVHRFILYGREGAGKNSILNHVIHACYRDNWVIVHVPLAKRYIQGPWKQEVTESSFKPGRYDLPAVGATWLSNFLRQNPGKLKDLKTTSEYVWSKREKAEIGTPLQEVINFGLTRIKFSSDCVGVILKELRQQAQTKGLKVFVGISSVNYFFGESDHANTVRTAEKRKLKPTEVSLIHNFKKMLSPTWTHGVVVCTVGNSPVMKIQSGDYTPISLLGKEGFEFLDPFVPILVPEYSEKEARSTIDYYIDRNWIQNDYGKTEEGKKEILFVSNKNPFGLYRVCSSL